jgi:predicted small secreted protein
MRKNIYLLLAVGAAGVALGGCHTVAGMGQDVEEMGGGVQQAANESS